MRSFQMCIRDRFNSHSEGYEYLKQQGIKIIEDYKICKTADEVWQAIVAIGENRDKLDYDIDGAVVKIDSFADRRKLGNTAKDVYKRQELIMLQNIIM